MRPETTVSENSYKWVNITEPYNNFTVYGWKSCQLLPDQFSMDQGQDSLNNIKHSPNLESLGTRQRESLNNFPMLLSGNKITLYLSQRKPHEQQMSRDISGKYSNYSMEICTGWPIR
jgi:hypothetical protein